VWKNTSRQREERARAPFRQSVDRVAAGTVRQISTLSTVFSTNHNFLTRHLCDYQRQVRCECVLCTYICGVNVGGRGVESITHRRPNARHKCAQHPRPAPRHARRTKGRDLGCQRERGQAFVAHIYDLSMIF